MNKYYCVDCDYDAKQKSNYIKHINTAKHKMSVKINPKSAENIRIHNKKNTDELTRLLNENDELTRLLDEKDKQLTLKDKTMEMMQNRFDRIDKLTNKQVEMMQKQIDELTNKQMEMMQNQIDKLTNP